MKHRSIARSSPARLRRQPARVAPRSVVTFGLLGDAELEAAIDKLRAMVAGLRDAPSRGALAVSLAEHYRSLLAAAEAERTRRAGREP